MEFTPKILSMFCWLRGQEAFQGSKLTLGQMADAVIYVGAGVDTVAKPAR